ncbi:MAG: hypothetical protein GX774_18520 [Armatimonadetes bacterium]|jgi:hypothetical protein|nr:hypothetical protein [Armatimonadota bacterium]
MPRTNARKRPVTIEDLTDKQRSFYESLPEEMRENYLSTLPPVPVSGAAGRKKARALRDRAALIGRAVEVLQREKERLEKLAQNLEQGGNAEAVDLREQLAPPTVPGISLRFIRARQ